MTEKTCSRCGETKPRNDFYRSKRNTGTGRQSWCKECVNSVHRAWVKENPERNLLKNIRYGARRRGLEFSLSLEDIVIPERCPVLGIPLEFGGGPQSPNSPSLDRIDNTKGYIKGNVVVVSLRANKLKSDATFAEIEALYTFYREVS